MAGWYVRRGEKVIGPVEVDKLKESVAAGKLLPTDQLSKDAAGPWTEASKSKLFAVEQPKPLPTSPPAPAAPPRTAIVPQAERLPTIADPQPEPQSKTASVVHVSKTIVSKVAGGTVATWSAIGRTLSTRAQRKHEIKLAKIHAQAIGEANRPPVSQQTDYPRPTPQQPPPRTVAPQIVQTTVVKVVNKNGGGCGCSGCGTLLLLLFIAFVAFSVLNPNRDRSPRSGAIPAATSTPSASDEKVSAWVMTQQFVQDKLKSPSSASFGGVFSDYQDPDDVVTDLGGGKYRVVAWVDSQNSFGAQIRTHFVCELEDVGNDKWRCTSVAFAE